MPGIVFLVGHTAVAVGRRLKVERRTPAAEVVAAPGMPSYSEVISECTWPYYNAAVSDALCRFIYLLSSALCQRQ